MSSSLVDLSQPWLYASVTTILFNPIFWNLVARNEYKNKSMTKIFGGAYRGTCVLAFIIFTLGIFRDWVYHKALSSQPPHPILLLPLFKSLGALLFLLGQTLVITSIYALGLTGTYLGDYFGILMKSRVTGFPFNVLRDPMYVGSTLCFLGGAFWEGRVAGVGLTGLVWVVYMVALAFEGPFTDKIYSSAAAKKKDESIYLSRQGEKLASGPISARSTGSSTSTSNQNVNPNSHPNSHSNSAGASSYASAVQETPTSSSFLPSTDPRPQVDLSHLGLGAALSNSNSEPKAGTGVDVFSASPSGDGGRRQVTRSRSRARIVDDD